MILYILPIIIYFIYVFFYLNKKVSINLISLSMFLLLALRENVGYDYSNYELHYQNRILPLEPISALLTQFSYLFNDPKYFFTIFAFFTIFIVRKVAIMNNSVVFLLMYLVLPGFFIESFTLVRQTLALSLVIYGVSLYIKNNNYYWILLIISCLTHFSAIPFTLIFLFFSLLKNKKLIATFGIFIPFIFIFINTIKEEMIVYFPRLISYDGSQQYGFSQLALFAIIFVITSWKMYELHRVFFWTILIGLFLTYAVISIDGVFIRLSYYFFVPFLFHGWNNILFTKNIKTFYWVIIFLPLFVYSLKIKTFDNFENSMLPYKTFLLK
jgi:hypothetical protein